LNRNYENWNRHWWSPDVSPDSPNLFFTQNYLSSEEAVNSFNWIKEFIKREGKENIFLVSKCGASVQRKTLHWLDVKDFYNKTGYNPANIRFCLQRHEKMDICKELKIEVFIDDRYSVLSNLLTLPLLKSSFFLILKRRSITFT